MTEAANTAYSRAQRPAGPPTPIAWLMGLTTCALSAGVIYWGVQLAQRDPMSLPVIRAPEGYARLEPTKLGGLQSEFDDLAVNDLQSGAASDGEGVIAMAPSPAGLAAEDVPALIELENEALEPVRVEIAEIDTIAGPGAPMNAPSTPEAEVDGVLMPVTAEEVELALAEALELAKEAVENADSAELSASDVAILEGAEAGDGETDEIDIASLILEDLKDDLEPAAEAETTTALEATETEDAAQEPVEVVAENIETVEDVLASAEPIRASDPTTGGAELASVAAGTRVIQLGAFGSRQIARDMWQTLQSRNADLLAGRSYFIQPVESGGKTLFRLRVLGFETTADARNMCAALVERKTPCIAVNHR